MPNREIASSLIVLDSIAAGNKSATVNGSVIDVSKGDAALIVISHGAAVEAGATLVIQHGDLADGSDAVTLVPVQDPTLDGFLYGPDYAAPVANTAHKYSYVGGKQFVRVVLGGTVTDTDLHAQVISGMLLQSPA